MDEESVAVAMAVAVEESVVVAVAIALADEAFPSGRRPGRADRWWADRRTEAELADALMLEVPGKLVAGVADGACDAVETEGVEAILFSVGPSAHMRECWPNRPSCHVLAGSLDESLAWLVAAGAGVLGSGCFDATSSASAEARSRNILSSNIQRSRSASLSV